MKKTLGIRHIALKIKNFEQLHHFKVKFDLISLIGSMTYCKNFDKLFANIDKNIKKKGFILFTHRVDLWKQQDFISILKKHQKTLKIRKISRRYYNPNYNFNNWMCCKWSW